MPPKLRCLALAFSAAALAAAAVPALAQTARQLVEMRERMVHEEILAAGITNARVVEAMRNTPRHEFTAFRDRDKAYFDMALPIGEGQTISPPFVVAFMTEQIDPQPGDKVLEIGTGSGYQAAVLSPLCKEVYSIEIVEPLGRRAAQTLKRLNYKNVFTKIGDGYQGWPEHAPFDKIIVTCSPESVPQALVDQLREGGRMIIPLGERYQQTLYLMKKEGGKLVSEALRPTLFVPMTGVAESQRKVQPDPLNPALVNGSFEEIAKEGDREIPKGWHYVRQAELVRDPLAPDGGQYLKFSNSEPGRGSQGLQGFPVDGRKIKELELSVRVKGEAIRPGQNARQLPVVAILFYDDKWDIVGEHGLGPWNGTFAWQTDKTTIPVPPKAVAGVIRMGLFGAVGEVSFDSVRLAPATRK